MDLREGADGAKRHPWELARASFFTALILREEPVKRRLDVLDIGAGDAFFAEYLGKRLPAGTHITCVDTSYDESWLGERDLGEGRRITFSRKVPSDKSYDWVTLLDVLEHVDDDEGLLREQVMPVLKAQGRALVSVPAWQVLFTKHDTDLGHVRRYSQHALQDMLQRVGLQAKLKGGLFTSLLLPRSLSKLAERLRGHRAAPRTELEAHVDTQVGTWAMGELPTWCIKTALEMDGRLGLLMARSAFPLPGLSVWSVSSKE